MGRRIRRVAIISGVAFVLAGAIIWYFVPELIVSRDLGPKVPMSVRAMALTSARQSVLLALGGVIAVAGVVATVLRLTFEHARSSLDVDENVTDRFSTAMTHLGHESPAVQNGGIYALQRLAQDSPREVPVVAQVIAAFVRTCAAVGGDRSEPERSALIMLATMGFEDLDLTGARLFDLQIPNASFRGARLVGADLHGCDLTGGDLEHARLDDANLRGAVLDDATLVDATLRNVQAEQLSAKRAKFVQAHIAGSRFDGAHLEDAAFDQSAVAGTSFENAQLSRTSFKGARLAADLSKAHFSDWLDLSKADLVGSTVLPPSREIEVREILLAGAWWNEEPGPVIGYEQWAQFYDRVYVTNPRIVYLRPTSNGTAGQYLYVDQVEEHPPRT